MDVRFINKVIAKHPGESRRQLSVRLCEAWEWKQANGVPWEMVARGLMLALWRVSKALNSWTGGPLLVEWPLILYWELLPKRGKSLIRSQKLRLLDFSYCATSALQLQIGLQIRAIFGQSRIKGQSGDD